MNKKVFIENKTRKEKPKFETNKDAKLEHKNEDEEETESDDNDKKKYKVDFSQISHLPYERKFKVKLLALATITEMSYKTMERALRSLMAIGIDLEKQKIPFTKKKRIKLGKLAQELASLMMMSEMENRNSILDIVDSVIKDHTVSSKKTSTDTTEIEANTTTRRSFRSKNQTVPRKQKKTVVKNPSIEKKKK